MKTRMPFVATFIATGFGSGFFPWGPGTAGALVATLMWLAGSVVTAPAELVMVTGALVTVFTILGTWATARVQLWWGDDPSRVVIDEMVGVWIPLMACPHGSWQFALLAFVLFRFFDILKPLGIRELDRKRGAFWVMADDILAGIYSLVVIILTRWVVV